MIVRTEVLIANVARVGDAVVLRVEVRQLRIQKLLRAAQVVYPTDIEEKLSRARGFTETTPFLCIFSHVVSGIPELLMPPDASRGCSHIAPTSPCILSLTHTVFVGYILVAVLACLVRMIMAGSTANQEFLFHKDLLVSICF